MTHGKNPHGAEFRRFNRFYTTVLGFLNEHAYDGPFSLTETRVLYEIYNTPDCTAKMLQDNLDLDRGYVSRIIKRFEQENMIHKQKSTEDSRNHYVYLTKSGEEIFKTLEARANQQIDDILDNLEQTTQAKLIEAMQTIESILSQQLHSSRTEITVRDYHLSGDIKTMIEKQRAFFAAVHGWDASFLDYLQKTFEGDIDKIWIAESGGKFAGCVGLVKHDPAMVQLRWFLVEPAFHKRGIGTQLMQNLLEYCRSQNYERVFLWTVSSMTEARKLYEKFGFIKTEVLEEKPLWGAHLVEERWDLIF